VRILADHGIIARIIPDTIADEVGLEPGDRLISVDGESIRDIIDLSFALSDESVELLIEKKNGEQEVLEIEKEYDEDLGIEFESAVFDGVRRCANKCIFCFVDQMAPNMRESLYVKDDDYRLSFLYGNFVTLTNTVPADIDRIRRLHLSPLYISIHTTNGALREKMLNNKNAGKIMEHLDTLITSGIEMHTQILL
jgi:putative radical SAM enzyme (TIGR03279 family)